MTVDNDDRQREAETVVEGEAIELPSDPGSTAAEPPPVAPASRVYEPEPHEARAPAGATAAPGSGWPDAGIDFSERPEYLVGAAFGGGLLLALILRKLGR